MTTRVLLVDVPAGLALLRQIMAGYDLLEAETLEKAERQLEQTDIGLMVVGIHFDDSRALDFINAARQHKNHNKTPIVMFRSLHSDIAEFLRSCIRDVSKIYNISSYVESDQHSSKQAIRASIEEALPIQLRSETVRRRTKAKRGRVLLAASLAVRPIAERMIADHHETVHAKTFDEARLLLEHEHFSGIVCTVLFDRARILDFVHMVKSNKKWKGVPLICARCPGTMDVPVALEAIELVCRNYGCKFVNWDDYRRDANPELQMSEDIEQFLCAENHG